MGDINSLVNGKKSLNECQYYSMFTTNGYLKNIDGLKLNADILTLDCYANMFKNCTGLSSIPQNLLQTTTLANQCYWFMFNGCTSLSSIPQNLLQITTLKQYCYDGMFSNCTNLTSVPANLLPATELTNGCYEKMFSGCTKLLSAKINATNVNYSYSMRQMFYKCSKLSSIEVAFTSWPTASNATTNWLSGVASTGRFICPATLPHTASYFDVSHIPPGWTVITK